jgi:hypothetical protein
LSLKFDNVEDRLNDFRKIDCEVADGFSRKKIRNSARNISENTLYSIERRGSYKNHLSDRSFDE